MNDPVIVPGTENGAMPESVKTKIARIAIPVLTSIITVLMIIPGEQGESVLKMLLALCKALVANAGSLVGGQ